VVTGQLDKYKVRVGKHFTPEQEEYLTKMATLDRWASKSLEERVQLFKARYPNAKISIYKLRKLYYRHKIKKKAIRISKVAKQASLMEIALEAAELS